MNYRPTLAVALLFPLLSLSTARAQNLRIPVSSFDNRTYGRGYESEVWAVACDDRNIIYAGNAGGLLEYDGSRWRYIPVRQGLNIRSLGVDRSGRICVGSRGEFGLVVPDSTGTPGYISLSDSLAEDDRFFSDIWKILCDGDTVYFQAQENLFVYHGGKLSVIRPETSFHTAFLVDHKLYVRQRGTGLMVLQEGELQPVEGGGRFADLGIFSMLPTEEPDRILIATIEKGLFLYRSGAPDAITPLKTGNDDLLVRAGIYGGLKLAGDRYAFNTLRAGVLITDGRGRVVRAFNTATGLPDDDVKFITTDRLGGIWCALNSGIARIDYSSPLSACGKESGLTGSVNAVARHDGTLFAGTTSGLFRLEMKRNPAAGTTFRAVPGLKDQVWDLEEAGGELLIGTGNGLYALSGGHLALISRINVRSLCYLEDEKLLYAAGNMVLRTYRNRDGWKQVRDFPDVFEDVIRIVPDTGQVASGHRLWLGTATSGVLQLDIRQDDTHTLERYGQEDGLGPGWVRPFVLGDSVVFGTQQGLMTFVDEKTVAASLPDSLKNDPDFARGYFEGCNYYGHPANAPFTCLEESAGATWAVSDNHLSLVRPNHPDSLINTPFRIIDAGEINCLYPDNGNILWLGTAEGLLRLDTGHPEPPRVAVPPFIRRVATGRDSVVFGGSFPGPPESPGSPPGVSAAQPAGFVPVIDHARNDISFRFALPYYRNSGANAYSRRLVGAHQDWTPWTSRPEADYIGLREGDYEFQVRARNAYGDVEPIASYRFTVRPPWYRSPIALACYLILAAAFIWLAVRLGQYRLRKKNERLEMIVQERTEEIRRKNTILTQQKQEIEDSIQYAEKIQRAVLPDEESLREKLPGYFILLKPKHYVSGDFYWLAENGNRIVVAAADCTGHGVPGAFMSMLGVSFLNKIIRENKVYRSGRILNELRREIIAALKSTGREGEQKDGMDIALCVIDLEAGQLEFSGANNPLYLVHEKELLETRPDKMPVAYYPKTDDYTSHRVGLKKGDVFYLFSDGFPDQFGGPKGKKFMYKRFKELLLEVHDRPMAEQKKVLDDTIREWMSAPGPDGTLYEQIDDILVIGIRI